MKLRPLAPPMANLKMVPNGSKLNFIYRFNFVLLLNNSIKMS